jgi:hypothetical protein
MSWLGYIRTGILGLAVVGGHIALFTCCYYLVRFVRTDPDIWRLPDQRDEYFSKAIRWLKAFLYFCAPLWTIAHGVSLKAGDADFLKKWLSSAAYPRRRFGRLSIPD